MFCKRKDLNDWNTNDTLNHPSGKQGNKRGYGSFNPPRCLCVTKYLCKNEYQALFLWILQSA